MGRQRTRRAAAAVAALALVALPRPARAKEPLPDLELDVARLEETAVIDTAIFHAPRRAPELDAIVPISGACVLDPDEACVGGPGLRKLLRFDVQVHNRGDVDLVIGAPEDRPDLFVLSACHRHFHFRSAARYELLDATGTIVSTGRKQGFCIEDTVPSQPPATTPRRYDCEHQGIQTGWSDLYPSFLDCQWIDVTDTPPGDYQLHVVWNPDGLMPESDLTNDEGTVPVTIPAPLDAPPQVTAIRSPAALSTVAAGRPLQVVWRASDDVGVVTQEVWLSTDDGASFAQLVGDLPGDSTSWTWHVPLTAATAAARLAVVARDASVQRGELVSGRFRIVRRPIRLPSIAR